jgi:hypothetical protein
MDGLQATRRFRIWEQLQPLAAPLPIFALSANVRARLVASIAAAARC